MPANCGGPPNSLGVRAVAVALRIIRLAAAALLAVGLGVGAITVALRILGFATTAHFGGRGRLIRRSCHKFHLCGGPDCCPRQRHTSARASRGLHVAARARALRLFLPEQRHPFYTSPPFSDQACAPRLRLSALNCIPPVPQISSDSTTRTPGRAARTAANNVAAIRSAGAIR